MSSSPPAKQEPASHASEPEAAVSEPLPPRPSIWARLLAYTTRRKGGWALAILGILLSTFALLLVLDLVGQLVTVFSRFSAGGAQAADLTEINRLLLFMVALTVLGNVLNYQSNIFAARLAQNMLVEIRHDYHASLMRHGPAFYRRRETGELVSIGLNDAEVIGVFFMDDLAGLLNYAGQLILALIFMASLSWQLTAGSLLLIALTQSASLLFIVPGIRRFTSRYRDQLAEVNATLNENLMGVRDIQIFNQSGRKNREFARELKALADSTMRSLSLSSANSSLFYMVAGLGLALIYGLGALGAVQGAFAFEVGVLVSFAAFFREFTSPVKALSSAYVQVQGMRVAAERVFGIMDVEPDIREQTAGIKPGPLKGHIRFENVTFSYDPDDPQAWKVKDVNLDIQPGEKVAFVGGSGSGKSTLINLVARFNDVTAGRVLIDGYDVRDLDLEALRQNLGLVAQNVMLFHGTVADNIRFARPEADLPAVKAAAEVGYADEFISKLEAGYDTLLGTRGEGLSGGQRQRVSIARAALPNPPILILDEATSALDPTSEEVVTRSLDGLSRGRTTLVIAHRLNTIVNADKIVVMGTDERGNGIVKAVGTHDELMESSEDYAELYTARTRHKAILMPIGPLYNTVPVLPTVIGLARAHDAPVYVLDFGLMQAAEVRGDRFGVDLEYADTEASSVPEINRAHLQRVDGLIRLLRSEGVECKVIQPAANQDWIEATIRAIDSTQATHLVAMENVLIPLEELRADIRRIQRKATVEYILVDPTIAAQTGALPISDVRGADSSAMETVMVPRRGARGDTVFQTRVLPRAAPAQPAAPAPALKIQPLGLLGSLGMFLWPAVWLFVVFYAVYPALRDGLGLANPAAFLLATVLGHGAELAAGLVLAWREVRGLPSAGTALAERLGLRDAWPQSRGDWGRLAVIALGVLSLAGLATAFEQPLVERIFPLPAGWADPQTMPLWALLALAQLAGPLMVVLGEEIYYRGYLLPKMTGVFEQFDWPINALLYIAKQAYQPWLAFRLGNLASAFAAAYYGKRRQLGASIAVHYAAYALALIVISA